MIVRSIAERHREERKKRSEPIQHCCSPIILADPTAGPYPGDPSPDSVPYTSDTLHTFLVYGISARPSTYDIYVRYAIITGRRDEEREKRGGPTHWRDSPIIRPDPTHGTLYW